MLWWVEFTGLVGARGAVLGQLLCHFAYRPFQMSSPAWTQLERLLSCITERSGQRPHLFSINNPDLPPPLRHRAALFPRRGLSVRGSSIHHGPERSFLSDSSIYAFHPSWEERTTAGCVTWTWEVTGSKSKKNFKSFTLFNENSVMCFCQWGFCCFRGNFYPFFFLLNYLREWDGK